MISRVLDGSLYFRETGFIGSGIQYHIRNYYHHFLLYYEQPYFTHYSSWWVGMNYIIKFVAHLILIKSLWRYYQVIS